MIGASAAVVCLGAALAACGGGSRGEGYVATGVAGGAPQASATAAAPTGGVTLVPLDGGSEKRGSSAPGSSSGNVPETAVPTSPDPAPSTGGTKSGRTTPDSPSPTATRSRTAPAGPAALTWSDPVREATDKRWCEDVTLDFFNSGGTAVRSGEVTFGTHVIGALGIDWGTVESTAGLPVPIGAGARKDKTWTVCVAAMGVPPLERSREWGSVPLGMHIETRDVTVQWK
ncbi:hypothetical protein [Streptomyces sp. NRRL S-646]|uniref:hypothetical protein n=1 Tax=Streptomyces sp. NRRL S-646 TaxID=1463917 RepID=UPI003B640DE9